MELAGRLGATKFVGYDQLDTDAVLQAILKSDRMVKEAAEGDEVEVALDVTPFYAPAAARWAIRSVGRSEAGWNQKRDEDSADPDSAQGS